MSILTQLETTSSATGIPMTKIMERAGLSHGAYIHWRNGGKPYKSTKKKLKRVIAELSHECDPREASSDLFGMGIFYGSCLGFLVGGTLFAIILS